MFRTDSGRLKELGEKSSKEFEKKVSHLDKVKICSTFKNLKKGTEDAIFGTDGDGIHFR